MFLLVFLSTFPVAVPFMVLFFELAVTDRGQVNVWDAENGRLFDPDRLESQSDDLRQNSDEGWEVQA